MKRTILFYGIAMAVLVGILKFAEYSFLVKDLAVEFYVGLIAVMFTALGAWIGWKLTHRPVPSFDSGFVMDESRMESLGISKREYEVLSLIAQGLSNREIADALFVSTHTVKSHSSNLFAKLNARRRTEAIKKAKELRLLP
ncbi:MAG: LuxR C-terminal-related transcriptional regulator [Bacteroidota bacterium]|jgi:DNA-binding CsgD family transcriptional regulator